jgi:hypothetical protein
MRDGPAESGMAGLEEAKGLVAVADQKVLRLAVVVEHHPVVLPAEA